jgi:hypothetical protein
MGDYECLGEISPDVLFRLVQALRRLRSAFFMGETFMARKNEEAPAVVNRYRVEHSVIGSQITLGPFYRGDVIDDTHFDDDTNIKEAKTRNDVKHRWLELKAIVPIDSVAPAIEEPEAKPEHCDDDGQALGAA